MSDVISVKWLAWRGWSLEGGVDKMSETSVERQEM